MTIYKPGSGGAETGSDSDLTEEYDNAMLTPGPRPWWTSPTTSSLPEATAPME